MGQGPKLNTKGADRITEVHLFPALITHQHQDGLEPSNCEPRSPSFIVLLLLGTLSQKKKKKKKVMLSPLE